MVDDISIFDSRESLIRDLLDFPLNTGRVDLGSCSHWLGLGDGRDDSLGRGDFLSDRGCRGSGNSAVGSLDLFYYFLRPSRVRRR